MALLSPDLSIRTKLPLQILRWNQISICFAFLTVVNKKKFFDTHVFLVSIFGATPSHITLIQVSV